MNYRKWICLILALLLVCALLPEQAASAYSEEKATLTFSDGGIEVPADAVGVSVSGTALDITASGTYRVTGSCLEGSIAVGKGLDVTLILDDLNLRASTTAPITVKKDSRVLLILEGESTLTDGEDASTEETNEDFEGAAVKVKTGSSLTVWGSGVLNAAGNAKNGLKGAAETALTVDGGAEPYEHGLAPLAHDPESIIMDEESYVVFSSDEILDALEELKVEEQKQREKEEQERQNQEKKHKEETK